MLYLDLAPRLMSCLPPVPRDVLMEVFWPTARPESAGNSYEAACQMYEGDFRADEPYLQFLAVSHNGVTHYLWAYEAAAVGLLEPASKRPLSDMVEHIYMSIFILARNVGAADRAAIPLSHPRSRGTGLRNLDMSIS
jgi:hypothetical protein